jgi:peptidyl-tRNA hydrolase, PTH1 family
VFLVDTHVQYSHMYYLVALGNPGDEYTKNRHNVGFVALDFFIKTFGLPQPIKSSQFAGRFVTCVVAGEEVSLLYPETFMNHSGSAVKKLVPTTEFSKLIVLYDDVALPLGEVKVSFDRGDGGHNGIKSIISSLNSKDFIRVRIGVGATSFWTGKIKPLSGEVLPKFVLSNFSGREVTKLTEEVFPKVNEVVRTILTKGYVQAMNTYN